MVEWPRGTGLGEMVYVSHWRKIVSVKVTPDPFNTTKNQGYKAQIHDYWAKMKDACYNRHHLVRLRMPKPRLCCDFQIILGL